MQAYIMINVLFDNSKDWILWKVWSRNNLLGIFFPHSGHVLNKENFSCEVIKEMWDSKGSQIMKYEALYICLSYLFILNAIFWSIEKSQGKKCCRFISLSLVSMWLCTLQDKRFFSSRIEQPWIGLFLFGIQTRLSGRQTNF